MTPPILNIFTHRDEFVQQTTIAIESAIVNAQKRGGEAHVAVSGGKSPIPVYKALVQSQAIDWSRLTLWLVDERYVPANHPESNQRMIRESFVERIYQLRAFHTFNTTLEPSETAKVYESELRNLEEPFFDLVLLGLGQDGHTASLFPGVAELHESERLAMPTWAEGYPTPERLTLTFPALLSGREIMFIIQGSKKQKILEKLLPHGLPNLPQLPSSFVLSHSKLSFYFLNI